jgi:hypothetical protein
MEEKNQQTKKETEYLTVVRYKKGVYVTNPFKDKTNKLLDIPGGETYSSNLNRIAVIWEDNLGDNTKGALYNQFKRFL